MLHFLGLHAQSIETDMMSSSECQPDITPALRTKLTYLRQLQNRLVIKIRIVRKLLRTSGNVGGGREPNAKPFNCETR
jgi:hypothetical protein